jgi:four helix bundle protein
MSHPQKEEWPVSRRIQQFEDFIAWKKARKLTVEVYKVTNQGRFASDLGLRNQSRRAAVSIMSNLAEGFERGGPAEFHRFLTISKGSCAELRAQIYVAFDVGYLDEQTFKALLSQAGEVGQVLGGLRLSVERRRDSVRASRRQNLGP